LCTIAGGEQVDVNKLAPEVAAPEGGAELKAGIPGTLPKEDEKGATIPVVPKEGGDKGTAPPPPAKEGADKPPAQAPGAKEGAGKAKNGHSRPVAIRSNTSATCQTGAMSKGKTMIFSSQGVLTPNAPKKEMAEAVAAGKMPKNRPRLSPDDAATLQDWLTATR